VTPVPSILMTSWEPAPNTIFRFMSATVEALEISRPNKVHDAELWKLNPPALSLSKASPLPKEVDVVENTAKRVVGVAKHVVNHDFTKYLS
jgi:hypothetical protein